MRKITRESVNALLQGRCYNKDNTRVAIVEQGMALFLHGNAIALVTLNGQIKITTAGYNTKTTKERLNGLPGVNLKTKKGQLQLNGADYDGSWVVVDNLLSTSREYFLSNLAG